MTSDKTILLLGGTSEIGLAICQAWLQQHPAKIILAGRKKSLNAEKSITLMENAGATQVEYLDFDATELGTHPLFFEKLFKQSQIDLAIVAFGELNGSVDWRNHQNLINLAQVNFTGALSVGGLLGEYMSAQGSGLIIALSSVAGMRVRSANFIYGSAKAGFDGFYINLGTELRKYGVNVVVVRPGQVVTKMTMSAKRVLFAVKPQKVAREVIRAVKKRKRIVWVPKIFAPIMTLFKILPQNLVDSFLRKR